MPTPARASKIGYGGVLSGDILQVVPSGHVSFMWSYPNLIPLSAAKVEHMVKMLEPPDELG